MYKHLNLGAIALVALIALFTHRAAARDAPPNVIIIYTDDQGTVDAGAYGAADLKTPGIDRIAREGVRFTQFYAPAPVCSPSRAGLLTGRYPVRAGVPGNVPSRRGHEGGMPPEQYTLAELFRDAGYRTAHIGKWHLGHTPETMPNEQGFDYSYGHMGGCIDNYSHFFYWAGPNQHDLYRNGEEIFENGQFFPDRMVEEAAGFMRDHRDAPFFIYFAMNAPHYPYQGAPEWLEHYRGAGTPYPRDLYAAFLSTLDERVGSLLDALDALGLAEDTIVVFQSDHGHSVEERAHFGGGSAGPYRGAKFSLFEGGIRVPAIIRWPGKLEAGGVRDQMAHGCDWFPTLAALCGISTADRDLDGKSLAALLKDPAAPSPHEALHWYVGGAEQPQWAVRLADWKLIGQPRDPTLPAGESLPPHVLVNLREDPGERENRVESDPDVFQRLLALHEAWAAGAIAE